jgi:putative ABC transport system permease protein
MNSPIIARWILRYVLRKESRNHRLGDFEEAFQFIIHKEGKLKAWRWYWFQVLKSIPILINSSIYGSSSMFTNYLKIAFRNIKNHKGYSFIIISGLTVSLALGFLIIQILSIYYSYDEFHENKDRIYRIVTHQTTQKGETDLASAPLPIATSLSRDCPGIEKVVRIKTIFNLSVINKTQKFPIDSYIVDPEFLSIFDFELEYGNSNTALTKPYSIILELEQSKKFF